ncbi:MAG: SH3 domain-containing protein [Bacteroidales bacterium]
MAEFNEDLELEQGQNTKKDKKKIIGGLLLGAIPLLFILYLVLGPVLHILSKDLKAKEMYVISEYVNVRATSDVNSLKMGKAEYGTKLLVYEIKDEFAEVLIDGQKGFVSSEFIAEPSVYYAIEGLFGDDRTENLLTNTKYKLALIRFLESKGYMSNIPDDIQIKLFGQKLNKEKYQIFTEPRGSKYNSSAFADFNGDYQMDAAFVLKSFDSDKKILVIFSFDKKDPLNKSKILFEYEISRPWYFIKLAKKGTKYTVIGKDKKPEKNKIPVNGLLLGTNRAKDLNDPEYLLIYNGEKFEMIEQVEE